MNRTASIFLSKRILLHILFWIAVYLFYSLTYGSYSDKYCQEFLSNLYILPVRIIGTYVFIYWLIPGFLLQKKYILFAVLAFVHAILFGFALWIVLALLVYCPGCLYEAHYPLIYLPKIFALIISNYEIPAVAAIVVLAKRWYADQKINRELEKEKLEAELKFLKSQINPHFLFNTLNNLYALTLKKSDTAPDVVLKLSEMLDYMLYHSMEKEVSLVEEINLIKAIVELEKIRYGKRLKLKMEITGSTENKYIAPLLLLPFIENSFKHGASSDQQKPYIDIIIQITDTNLELLVTNSFVCQLENVLPEGIGLKNVKRRLEIQYRDRYELNIEKNENLYRVQFLLYWSGSKTSQ
jgi:two-component system LytT family sensor kinase